MSKPFTQPGFSTLRLGNRSAVAYLLVFSLALILPAAYFGIPENYDLGQHLRFARTYFDTFSNASTFPSWGASDNNGLGSAGVRFYPPLTHVVMALIQLVSHSWYDTLWLSMLLWMFVGCVGTYFLAKEWLTTDQAFLTAVLYALVPYHLLQVFQAFLLAEFVGAAILPFCFLYAYRICRHDRWIDSLLFAVFFSALILSHIPSTIMGALSLGIFVVCLLERKSFIKTAVKFASAFVASLALTSFYWARMVSELQWVKHNTSEFYAAGFYNYSTYFFPMLLSAGEAYVPQFLWLMDICIVLTYILFIPIIAGVILDKRNARPLEKHILALIATGLFTLFIMSSLSKPLWDSISFLQKLQFPFRWLGPASLMAALAFPTGVIKLTKYREKLTRPFAYSLAFLLLIVLIFDITQIVVPSAPVPRSEIETRISSMDREPGCECWWPIWAKNDAFENSEKIFSDDRVSEIISWENTSRVVVIEAGEPMNVRIATFYYPHWRSEVNGKEVPVGKDENGAILIPLPPEKAEIHLFFKEPEFLRIAKYVSLTAWLGLIVCLLVLRTRFRPSNKLAAL